MTDHKEKDNINQAILYCSWNFGYFASSFRKKGEDTSGLPQFYCFLPRLLYCLTSNKVNVCLQRGFSNSVRDVTENKIPELQQRLGSLKLQ